MERVGLERFLAYVAAEMSWDMPAVTGDHVG